MLTGLWLYWLLSTSEPVQEIISSASVWHRVVVTISIAGALMLQWDTSVYLGLLLAWAG